MFITRSLFMLLISITLLSSLSGAMEGATTLSPRPAVAQISFSPEATENQKETEELRKLLMRFLNALNPQLAEKFCRIRVVFTNLDGYWGSIETERNIAPENHRCDYEINVDSKLIGKMEARLALIHELAHLVRDQANPNETRWLNEGLAQLVETEYIGIWPFERVERIKNQASFSLHNADEAYTPKGLGYGTSYLFVKYLFDQYGGQNLLRLLINSPLSGWDNIESALAQLERTQRIPIPKKFLTRESVWAHFAMAMYFNDSAKGDYNLLRLSPHFKVLPTDPLFSQRPNSFWQSPSDWQIFYWRAPLDLNLLEASWTVFGIQTSPKLLIKKLPSIDTNTPWPQLESLVILKVPGS